MADDEFHDLRERTAARYVLRGDAEKVRQATREDAADGWAEPFYRAFHKLEPKPQRPGRSGGLCA
jgi:hypothetical protein